MTKIFSVFAIAGMGIAASCNTASNKESETALKAQQYTIDSMKMEMAKKQVIDSMSELSQMQVVVPQVISPTVASTKPAAKRRARTHRSYSAPAVRETANTGNVYTGNSNTQPVYTTPTQPVVTQAPVEKKKGWSAKAKGAVIGAGAGAIGGAVINKDNRAKGAVLGGILGAAGGLGVGAIIDKKNGR